MPDIITVDDLASYPGVVLREEATNALVVDLANGLVLDVVGDLSPVPTRVRALTLEVAARALRNPEGYTSVTKSIDDWDETVRREGTNEGAGVYLTDSERAVLLASLGRPIRRVGSIRLKVPGYADS